MKNPVIHFEMGYFDKDRMKKFYQSAFDWKLNEMPDMGGYVLAQTAEADEKGMSKVSGAINGGLYKKDSPASYAPSIVISVPDIKAAMEAVKANGGTILGAMDASGNKTMEPTMIPGVGLWISIKDTEDNRVSLLQPLTMQ